MATGAPPSSAPKVASPSGPTPSARSGSAGKSAFRERLRALRTVGAGSDSGSGAKGERTAEVRARLRIQAISLARVPRISSLGRARA